MAGMSYAIQIRAIHRGEYRFQLWDIEAGMACPCHSASSTRLQAPLPFHEVYLTFQSG